ncbi:MAG: hypothetical protein JST00_20145 [Deltaproteobacteria bacterium]|nr:hypothetical protein [Deltaproteobacteria bacterium]
MPHAAIGRTSLTLLTVASLAVACSSRGEEGTVGAPSDGGSADTSTTTPPPEKRCGPGANAYSAVYTQADIARLAGCTVYVGRLQEDSVEALADFSGLESLRTIEGTLNVFRSPGFVTMKGLENLETVDGDLFIHMNPNLRSITEMRSLRLVTGRLEIFSNGALPIEQARAFAESITVRGAKRIEP